MKNRSLWVILAVVIGALAAGFFYWQQRAKDAPRAVPTASPPSAPAPLAKPAPGIQFPLGETGVAPSLPTLELSDTSVRALLASLVGRKAFDDYFSPQNIIRRIVATVDNLAREKAAQRLMPLRPVPGRPMLTGEGDNRALSPANSARYLPYVVLAESVDAGALVAAYIRFYPLFQQAYKELGYPSEYFNDRLVQVIDHLLATPEISAPLKLVQPKVLYEFADPELEARSAGQKIMIRIGAENAARLKTRLRDFRRELTARAQKP